MGKVIGEISMSLDGFIAGPRATLKVPLGKGGEDLHEWVVRLEAWRKPHGMSGGETGPDNKLFKESTANNGASLRLRSPR